MTQYMFFFFSPYTVYKTGEERGRCILRSLRKERLFQPHIWQGTAVSTGAVCFEEH